jgi:Chaperone of endosialidase
VDNWGVALSSARYKRDIREMGNASAGLIKLRPVSFRYKDDSTGTLQYGLVAEEVAQVYPELVTRSLDGKVQSVRYLEFTALLLNELQKQARETQEITQRLETKDQQLAAQQHEIDALKQQNTSINVLSQRLAALERQAHTAPRRDFARSPANKRSHSPARWPVN